MTFSEPSNARVPEFKPEFKPTFGRMMRDYALACAAATVLLPVLLGLRDMIAIGPSAAVTGVGGREILSIAIFGYLLIFVFAAPFATALIVACEALKLRNPLVYAGGGLVIGPIVGLIARALPALSPDPSAVHFGSFILYALIGLVAGGVFWALAFRNLGAS